MPTRSIFRPFCTLLALLALCGPARGQGSQQHGQCDVGECTNALVVPYGHMYTLTGHESYCTVLVAGVLFTADYTLTVTGAGGLNVMTTGLLWINATGGALTLTADSTVFKHRIDGWVWVGSGADVNAQHNIAFTGTGRIEGLSDAAQVNISMLRTLTNELATPGEGLRGHLQVAGLGTFRNFGLVEAQFGTIHFTRPVTDNASAQFRVIAGAEMEFDVASTSLQGDFTVNGTLDIDASVTTCGDLEFNTGGTIQASMAAPFRYLTYSGSAANPGTSDTFSCGTGYKVQ